MNGLGPFKENTIIVGDCLDIMAQMPDGCVDLVITDPPYGVSYRRSGKEEYMIGDTVNLFPYFMPDFRRLLRPDGAIYLFSSTTRLVEVLPLFQTYFKLHSILVWDKQVGQIPHQLTHYKLRWEPILYGSKGLHQLNEYKDDVISCPIVRGRKRLHITQKPEDIIAYCIENSTQAGDIVADFFMGSGTTAVVADRLGRKFFGCDINPDYVKTALERLEKDRAARQLEMRL